MIFGFLIGIAGFLGMAFLGGFVEGPEVEAGTTEPQYASATERLEKYRCRAGETKQVIMGGIEDGYDPAGDEPVTVTESARTYLETRGSDYTLTYDNPLQDRFFVDAFDIPDRTFHGIMAIGLEERSGLKNDGIYIGYFEALKWRVDTDNHRVNVSDLAKSWKQETNYVWTNLDEPKLVIYKEKERGGFEVEGFSHLSLLDAIRRNHDRLFEVQIADDTIVDFIGFSLCLEPEEHKGTVVNKDHPSRLEDTIDFGEGFVNLYNTGGDYEGDVYCTEARPIPCIDDQNLDAPNAFTEYSNGLWSGGYIKFTDAVPGNRFKREEEVDAFCSVNFGGGYRSVNMKDGAWMGAMVGYGEYPEGYDEFWVHIKDSPHQNCWAQRMDYEDLAALEAIK